MSKTDSQLKEILSAFEGLNGSDWKTTPISKEKVKTWLQSENIEVLGAVYALITNEKKIYLRIKPPLEFNDYLSFIMRYFERCFRENPESEWALSRYAAGWDIVNWFVGFWNDTTVPRKTILKVKVWLGKLYKEGDEEIRTCIITATLEHLFEHRQIARYFADWRKDLILRPAYDEALGHGYVKEK